MNRLAISLVSLLSLTATARAGLEQRQLSAPFSAPPLMGVSGFTLSPDSTTAAYRANPNSPTRQEHFLVPLAGGSPLSANFHDASAFNGELRTTTELGVFSTDSTSFHSFGRVETEFGEAIAIQVATRGTAGAVNRLVARTDGFSGGRTLPYANGIAYLEDVAGQVIVVRTTAADAKQTISPDPLSVTDWRFTPDGTRLITSGTGGSVSGEAVYSTHQTTLTSTSLTPAPVTGGGIDSFLVSPDSATVVIKGTISATTHAELYAMAADGSGSLTSLVGAPFSAGDYAVTPDSTKVVYLRSGGAGGTELFVKPLTGGTPVKLNGTLPSPAAAVRSFKITADSQRVVYLADQTTAGRSELYSTALDGTGNTKLNAAISIPAGKVTHFQLTPDGTKVIYRADAAALLRFELFQVSVTGGSATRLHAPLTLTRSIAADFAVPSNAHAIFRGDVDGLAGQTRLYAAPLNGSAPVRLDSNTLADGDVTEFQITADGAKVAYLADTTNDGSMELHAAWGAPDCSALPDRWGAVNMPVPALPFLISDIETPATALTITATSSNQALIPNSGLTLTGTAESRNLSFAPVAGVTGSTLITLTISDGVHATVRTFRVTRYSTGYWTWLVDHFTLPVITNGALKSSTWGPYADPDGDGRANFEEYAYNTSPKNSADALNPLTLSLAAGARVHASHLIRTSEPLLTYSLEAGTSLTAFDITAAAVEAAPVSLIAESPSYSRLTRRLTKSTANAPAQFARLKVAWTSGE